MTFSLIQVEKKCDYEACRMIKSRVGLGRIFSGIGQEWDLKRTCVLLVFVFISEPQDGVQPWFITKPKSTTVCEGQHALLSCAIAGDPFPEFLWMKDGQAVSSGQDVEVLQKEDVVSLLIRRVKTHHAGNYEIHLKYECFKELSVVIVCLLYC